MTRNRTKRRRIPRGQLLLLAGMAYGTVLALLLLTAGFVSLARQGGVPAAAAARAAQAGSEAGQGQHAGHGGSAQAAGRQDPANAAPDIRIEAAHRGNLVLEIKAEVSMNKDRDPLIRAKTKAVVDMVGMPGAHTKGPIELTATQNPGEYTGQVTLPMPGDYEVKVSLDSPVQGQATKRVQVGLVDPGAADPDKEGR